MGGLSLSLSSFMCRLSDHIWSSAVQRSCWRCLIVLSCVNKSRSHQLTTLSKLIFSSLSLWIFQSKEVMQEWASQRRSMSMYVLRRWVSRHLDRKWGGDDRKRILGNGKRTQDNRKVIQVNRVLNCFDRCSV